MTGSLRSADGTPGSTPPAGGDYPGSRPPWLLAIAAAFLVLIGVLLISSLVRPEVTSYAPSPPADRDEPEGFAGPDTLTIDARAGEGWVGLDIARRRVGAVEDMAGAWDVAAQRHRLAVNGGAEFAGGAGVLFSESPFDSLFEAAERGYSASLVTPSGDTVSAVLDEWYAYHFLSHLLEPESGTFVIRTAAGKYAKLRVLGYYCPGAEPGCVTVEFAYQGDGSRRLSP
ncbi:MAG: HmuY family protein [Gemmatimonadota bacterium]